MLSSSLEAVFAFWVFSFPVLFIFAEALQLPISLCPNRGAGLMWR